MKLSRKHSATVILGLLFSLATLPLLHAQTATQVPTSSNPAAASPAPASQASDDMTKKITDLVHAGKYTEAQQLTTGLLVAYPNDQRLIKAKALIDKLLSPAGSTNATPGNGQPAQPASNADQLTGMDKVDYSALIVLARQAKQATDRSEQQTLLQQFMDQSNAFLQKFPDQMLLWQLRATAAISLTDPRAGYEAGQKLMAAGAADSDDPNLQELLGQLKNKHWLDKAEAEKQAKFGWLLGTWNLSCAEADPNGNVQQRCDPGGIEFSKLASSDSVADGYRISGDGVKKANSAFRVTVLASGEIRCEEPNLYNSPEWVPVLSCNTADNNRSLTIHSAAYKPKGYIWTWSMHKN
ncbi:MAG: hypothetical protein WCD47_20055 [Candidatus Sulfotelmatobacter sp.]